MQAYLTDPAHWRFTAVGTCSLTFGVYDCFMCGVRYTVNAPNSWNPCSPDYCPDCHELPEPL